MTGESQGSCDHLSPHHFRGRLEEFLLEHGYEGLETDRLMCEQDPELFYNMLWYFHIFDLQMIPSDPKHREKMRIITHWASPRVLEKTVSCDDEDDKLIKSIVKCLKVKNVLGAVSLLLTARKKAHESMETEDYDRRMATAIGTSLNHFHRRKIHELNTHTHRYTTCFRYEFVHIATSAFTEKRSRRDEKCWTRQQEHHNE